MGLKATQILIDDCIKVSWSLPGSELSFRTSVHIPKKQSKLADRLCRAIEAGVAITDVQTKMDVFGNTYLHGTCNFLMRHLNADLKRMGY